MCSSNSNFNVFSRGAQIGAAFSFQDFSHREVALAGLNFRFEYKGWNSVSKIFFLV
jgi:hypothetical protein